MYEIKTRYGDIKARELNVSFSVNFDFKGKSKQLMDEFIGKYGIDEYEKYIASMIYKPYIPLIVGGKYMLSDGTMISSDDLNKTSYWDIQEYSHLIACIHNYELQKRKLDE